MKTYIWDNKIIQTCYTTQSKETSYEMDTFIR